MCWRNREWHVVVRGTDGRWQIRKWWRDVMENMWRRGNEEQVKEHVVKNMLRVGGDVLIAGNRWRKSGQYQVQENK